MPGVAARLVASCRPTGRSSATVICSQGKLIPAVLAELTGDWAARYQTAKGSGWVLSFGTDSSLLVLDALD